MRYGPYSAFSNICQTHKHTLKVSWKVTVANNTKQMEKEIIFQAERIKKEL